jgi:hypothetical protein
MGEVDIKKDTAAYYSYAVRQRKDNFSSSSSSSSSSVGYSETYMKIKRVPKRIFFLKKRKRDGCHIINR